MTGEKKPISEVFWPGEDGLYNLSIHKWATGHYSREHGADRIGRPYLVPKKSPELELSSVEEHSLNLRKIGQAALEKSQQ